MRNTGAKRDRAVTVFEPQGGERDVARPTEEGGSVRLRRRNGDVRYGVTIDIPVDEDIVKQHERRLFQIMRKLVVSQVQRNRLVLQFGSKLNGSQPPVLRIVGRCYGFPERNFFVFSGIVLERSDAGRIAVHYVVQSGYRDRILRQSRGQIWRQSGK
ncbi:hypothetical protein SDC9_95665 [bioreactor metagenome]|uniref:Uncharacterized protein n=1 Tax=bioreactor metagenome TaxID=1076179 RepID=A0A645A8B0_9ZZZZ